jgi:hypothetical protein
MQIQNSDPQFENETPEKMISCVIILASVTSAAMPFPKFFRKPFHQILDREHPSEW